MKKTVFSIMLIFCVSVLYAQNDTALSRTHSFSSDESDGSPLFSNYYEAIYGFGLSEHNHYLGLNYTHRFGRLGVNASAMMGIGNSSISLQAGPAYTFRMNSWGGNWHIYSGIGGTWNDSLTLAWQLGLRYSFNEGYLNNTETWSLTAGVTYVNREIVPTLGVSITPAALKFGDWWDEKENRYPHHYGELLGGYGQHGFMIGTNYAYMPARVGIYGSFLYGFDAEEIFANIGPVLRLNSSENWPVDIQVFQGFGWHHQKKLYLEEWGEFIDESYGTLFDAARVNSICGETGVRFGFGRDRRYGMWSLSTSVIYSRNYAGVTLGMSWPIAGITAAAAGIALYAYAVVSTGGQMPDVSEWGKSSSSPGSTTGGGKSPKSGDCASFQKQYNEQELNVIQQYKEMDWSAHHGGSTINITMMNKKYHQMQSQLKHIRLKARQNGCKISQSSWETKMWNGSVRSPFDN